MPERVKRFILHHSSSEFGHVLLIDRWHREDRGWKMCGYHFVGLNGWTSSTVYFPFLDGCVEVGRPMDDNPLVEGDEIGAHAYGNNRDSIGYCMIGNGFFTINQLIALKNTYKGLIKKFGHLEVSGHGELSDTICPGIPMNLVREYLSLPSFEGLEYLYQPEFNSYIDRSILR